MFARLDIPPTLLEQEPTYLLEHGATWQCRARDLGLDDDDTQRYVVRRLGDAESMLLVGAVLKRTSQLEHPRLYGPSAWRKDLRGVWIATPRPLGVPLCNALTPDAPRHTWAQALELWSPLADAVHRAHQRGVIHGQITPWTVWYDQEAERLTLIDAGCWIGDRIPDGDETPWWAPEIRCEPVRRMPSPFIDIYGLARLLLYLVLPEAEVLRATPNLAGLPAFALPALARAVHEDPSQRLGRVEELVAATARSLVEAYDERTRGATDDEITSVLGARIGQRERFEHPRLGDGVKFFLNLPPEADLSSDDQVGAFFYEGADPSLFHSIRWGWEGAEVNLLDARVVTDSKERRFVTSHRETLPVLEPTFPISVSNVLKAERCTSRFLVDERDGGDSSRALVLGNLVHGLLEALTSPTPPSFEGAFAARLRAARLALLAAGLTDEDIPALERDARQHYANLQRFTRPQNTNAEPDAPAPKLHTGRARHGSVYQTRPDATWSGRHIEVTRYSPLYGLEGRIDLATEDDTDGLQIIELKSGSAWDGHLSQVRCYTLLWDGLAKERGLEISGYVLYSRYGRLNAVPMDDISRERRILRARNELIALHRSYVDSTYAYRPPHFMEQPRNCNSPSCKFRRDRCAEQTETLGLHPAATPQAASALGGTWEGTEVEVVARAWSYWKHMTRLVEMERWAQHASVGAIFQRGRLGERIKAHRALPGMEISGIDLSESTITFKGRGAQIFSPRSSLIAHRGDLHAAHILKGRVVDVSPDHVTVRTQGAQIASTLERSSWILDHLPARVGVRHAHRALYAFMRQRSPKHLQALLMPESEQARACFEPIPPEDRPPPRNTPADLPALRSKSLTPTLNDSQKRALDAALHAPLGALIQGPPGTGKTTVIAQIVRELLLRGERVLVCAQTNTAVDTILSKVVDAGVRTFLRVGGEEKSPNLAMDLESAGADPGYFFTETLSQRVEGLRELAVALETCPLYGCTTHAAVSASIFEYLGRVRPEGPLFDVVVVDEASQITEPMTLAAINRAERFVLVGDHRQLPPIVQSEQALSAFFDATYDLDDRADEDDPGEEDLTPRLPVLDETLRAAHFQIDPELRRAGVAGLDRSLFERLVERLPHVMLEEQYRMHEDVMAFSNAQFYRGRLTAHPDNARRLVSLTDGFLAAQPGTLRELLSPEHPVTFVHVEGVGAGRSNQDEAKALTRTLESLLHPEAFRTGPGHGPRPKIGVISPFRAQVQLLRDMLHERLGEVAWDIDVDTVERYQGGERDVILVSTVKTERAGTFLADMRRLNVTLTRARSKLIVFGYKPCLMLNPLYRELLAQPQTHHMVWDLSAPPHSLAP
ncbi:MAG: PLuB system helicase-like protein [Myxococcota bacterium]